MLNPIKDKYYPMYWDICIAASKQSVATRHQVGALVVTTTGMMSVGFNGTPAGYYTNDCEDLWVTDNSAPSGRRRKTNPATIHAEQNAISKMTKQGVPTFGAILFITRAPCFTCSKLLSDLGFSKILYLEDHDDMSGVQFLLDLGIDIQRDELK